MRHFDYSTDIDDDLPPDVVEILRSTTRNQQLFDEDQVGDEGRYTTASLRFTQQERVRPDFSSLEALPETLQTEATEEILQFFGYDGGTRFQLSSWKEICERLEAVRRGESERDQAAVLNAPTGFGKTAAFLGPAYRHATAADGNRTVIVYPSRALIKDQLGRILETVDKRRESTAGANSDLSVGVWMGRQPWKKSDVTSNGGSFVDTDVSPPELQVASHWKDDLSTLYVQENETPSGEMEYRVVDQARLDGGIGQGVTIPMEDLILHREKIKESEDDPEILLTTLESFESLATKPHYDVVTDAEYFVFDEIHQYQGLRGSHAAQIVRNLRQIKDEDAVFVGASATIDDPREFGEQLFGFTPQTVEQHDTLTAGPDDLTVFTHDEEDVDTDNDDALYYYFMLAGRGQDPGAASQYIQHAMMVGRSLTAPDPHDCERGDEDPFTLPPVDTDTDTGDPHRKLLAFIQSKSRINRMKHQFGNADKDLELWKYHDRGQDGDWRTLAERTNHRFLDQTEDLDDPIAIYSGEDSDDVADIDQSSLIHGTSFLEVGIDIENLHFVSQYRPPESITTFKQRAGRAAREKGTSGHVFVHLSDFGGDTNFHYRADRFVDGEVSTPIRARNEVASWMHDRFHEHYECLAAFKNNVRGNWSSHDKAPNFINKYFGEILSWNGFVEFLTCPKKPVSENYDVQCPRGNILQNEKESDEWRPNKLKNNISERRNELLDQGNGLSHINKIIDSDPDAVLSGEYPMARLVSELGNSALDIADTVRAEVDSEELDNSHDELIDLLQTPLPQLDTESTLESINDLCARIQIQKFKTDKFPGRKLELLQNAIRSTENELSDESLARRSRERRALYFLRLAVEQVDNYLDAYVANHGQLRSIKALFRAAYYYNRSLQTIRETDEFQLATTSDGDVAEDISEEHEQIWYVPPNYFNDAGKYFTLISPTYESGQRTQSSEESVSSILSQYIPFKVEHRKKKGDCQVFLPRVRTPTDAPPTLDVSAVEGTNPRDWLLEPDSIELEERQDLSQRKAQRVYAWDRSELTIAERGTDEPGVEPARIFSSAHVDTRVETTGDPEYESGPLELVEADVAAWIERLTLEVTPMVKIDDSDGPEYVTRNDDPRTHQLETEEPKLGYALETRAVQWDLSGFFDDVTEDGSIGELATAVRMPTESDVVDAETYKSFEDITQKESAYVTAAHLLKLLIADVAGIDQSILMYGYDECEQSVYVFEQTQGGQGIVDLFCDLQERRPDLVLNSLYRLLHNPQILNERLWADETAANQIRTAVAETEDRGETENRIEEILRDQYGLVYPSSVSRLTEEVTATVDRIESMADRSEVSSGRLFELKHRLARAHVHTPDEFDGDVPEQVRDEFDEVIDAIGDPALGSLFVPHDVHACAVNLQLDRTISNVTQDEALSYCILERLEEYLVDRVDESRDREAIVERQAYWAWLDARSDEVLFISW